MRAITWYNKLGDPVEMEDNSESNRAMEKAGFSRKAPRPTKQVREDLLVEEPAAEESDS